MSQQRNPRPHSPNPTHSHSHSHSPTHSPTQPDMKRNHCLRIVCLLLLLCGLVPASDLPAQDIRTNMEKYWLYRARLWDRFIVLGTGQGMGIPAALYDDAYNDNSTHGSLAHMKVLAWSDATALLGYYIAMLATEYAVLDAVGDPTAKTEEELYYALNALWRLDASSGLYSYDRLEYSSGACYGPSGPVPGPMDAINYNDPAVLDGFFIRDDVPVDFANQFTYYDTITSDLTAPLSRTCRGKEMSQDQVTALLLGLMCVKSFVEPTVTWNGVPLVDFAVTEGLRILDHCKGNGDWVIRNPHISGNPPVKRGPNGVGFPPALSYIGFRLSDDSIRLTNAADFAQNPIWQALQYPYYLIGETKYINETMISNLAATGDSWGFCPNVYIHPTIQYASCAVTASAASTSNTRRGLDRYVLRAKEAQYLIHHLIFDSDWSAADNISEQSILAMLDTAPCEGPSSPEPNSGIYGWTTENRFWVPRIVGAANKDVMIYGKDKSEGQIYSGIDYMLLHNLYFLWRFKNGFGDAIQFPYENLLDANVSRPWPIQIMGISNGSQQSPIIIRTIENITSTSEVRVLGGSGPLNARTGDVTFRAGNQIDLKPGFSVALGAEFHAFIQPMECIGGVINRMAPTPLQEDFLYQLYQDADKEEERFIDSLEQAAGATLKESAQTTGDPQTAPLITHIIPNPSEGNFTIRVWVTTITRPCTVSLISPDGKLRMELLKNLELQAGENEIGIDLKGNVPAGLYSLLLTSRRGVASRQLSIIL
jgi:hypothetical protein